MVPHEHLSDHAIDRFWETVPPLWNFVRSHIRATATTQFDITVEQFHILRHIRQGRGSVSEIAQAKHISRPAISQAMEALVNKGLVSRNQSSLDRRHVKLELTVEGNALLDAIFEDTSQWLMKSLASLSDDELQSMIQTMESLKRALPA